MNPSKTTDCGSIQRTLWASAKNSRLTHFQSPVSSLRFLLQIPLARAAALALALLASPALLVHHASAGNIWDGGSNTNNWGGLGNWDANALPAFNATTDLYFRSGTAGQTITAITVNRTVRSITFGGNVTSGFEIRLTQNTYNNPFNLTMGNATNAAAITIDSSITGNIIIGKGSGTAGNDGNLILGNNLTVTQNSTVATLTIDRPITDSGSSYTLTKNGSGTLTLSGANTYTGTTTINAGNLTLSGGSAIVNNGTISLADTAGAILHVAASETIGSLQGGGTTGGNVSIAASQTLTVAETGTTTFGGVILGSGGLTKSGAGTLTLSGNNTYTGATTISAGTLEIGSAGRLGSGSYAGNIANSGTFIYSGTNDQTLSGVISGTGALTQNAASTLTLSGNNTYTGLTTINAGTLKFQANTFNATSRNYTISSGAVLNLDGANKFAGGNSTISGSGKLLITGGQFQGQATASPTVVGNISLGSGGTIEIASGATLYNGGFTSVFWESNLADMIVDGTLNVADGRTVIVDALTGSGTIDKTISTGTVTLRVGADDGTGTFSGTIKNTTGSTALTKNGTGTQTLTGNNTYSGATTISAGTLEIGAAGRLGAGSYAGNISNNANLIYSGTNDQTLSGIISGSGALTQNAASTLTLSNANTYTGTTTINAGTIALGANQNIGAISGAGALNLSTYTLTTNASSDTTFSGIISGTGSLTKNGTGTLTLSNTNTYNGATTINAGTLAVSGDIANSGLVINSGGIISPGTSGAVDTFGTSSITINGGGYNWTLSSANGSAGTGYDQITSTGALTSSGLLTVYAYGTPGDWNGSSSYDWDIFSANSVSVFSEANFALNLDNFGIAAGNRTGTWSFSNPSGGIIRLSYAVSGDPVWVGGSGNWDTGFTPGVTEGANIAFVGAGGTATNNISNGTLTTVGDIEFRSGAGAYTLAANAGAAGASGGTALTVNGSIINDSTATQTLDTDLAFAATRTIAANTGNITIGGAISGAGGLTKNGSNKLTLTAANTYTGDTTINTGTLEIGSGSTTGSLSASSAITNNANLVFNRSNDLTVSNTIGGTGNLAKSGAGTLTLSGSSNYSGTTTISAGALRATHANALGSTAAGTTVTSGASLELSGGISIGAEALSLSGTGISSGGALRNISGDNSYAGAITLAAATLINSDSGNLTLSGIMSGSNALTKNGSGRLTLSAASTYTGGTTVNGGTLAFTDGTTSAIGNGTITINNGSTLSLNKSQFYSQSIIFGTSGGGNLTTTYNGIKFSGSTISTTGGATNFISGSTIDISTPTFNVAEGTDDVDLQVSNFIQRGGITKSGAGKLLLTNNNAFNVGATHYTITINAGALEIGATGRLVSGSYSGNITNNGIFIYSGTNAQTLSGIISGTGALTQNAASTLTLSGNNTYSGTTTISDGTIVIGAAGRLGAGSYAQNISNNGTLIYTGTNNQTLSGIISGSGALTQNAASTLTLSGNNTYSGGTTINDGAIVIGAAGRLGAGSYAQNISNNGTLIYTGTNNQTLSGIISGSGALTQNAASTLTLSGNNTYSGATTITAGTIQIASTGLLGGGNYSGNISNSGTFIFGSNSNQTLSGIISGAGELTKNGTGTLTLSGNNSYSGETSIEAGALQITAGGLSHSSSDLKVGSSIGSNATLNIIGGIVSNNQTYIGYSSGSNGVVNVINGTLSSGLGMTIGLVNGSLGTLNLSGGNVSSFNGKIAYDTNTTGVVNVSNGDWSITYGLDIGRKGNGMLNLSGGNVIVNSGYNTLSGSGTINLGLDSSASGTINLGDGATVGTLQAARVTGGNGTAVVNFNHTGNYTFDPILAGSLSLNKLGTGTTILSANNTYTGATTISAGTLQITSTGLLGGGNYSGNITNNGALLLGSNSNQTLGGVISGNGAITKSGSGTLTLSGSNTYSGGTTLSTGTLVIAAAAAAGTGTITQTDGTSLLKFDTTGTITNNMSIYNVASNQTMTLSGSITAQNTTYDVASGTTLSINGTISGSGGVTKNGTGTLVLSGSNSYNGSTTVNAGTLSVSAASAMGATTQVILNTGGSLLIGASNSINDGAAVTLAGGKVEFTGSINETLGLLSVTVDSIIDMAGGNIWLEFAGVAAVMDTFTLKVRNYTLYSDHLYFTSNTNLTPTTLSHIRFYSGSDDSSFIGNSFIENSLSPYHVRPVPEPETYATAALLLIGLGIYAYRRRHSTSSQVS